MLARSYKTALPFAEDLVSKNIKLATVPSTILSELVGLSTPLEFERVIPTPNQSDYETEISEYGNFLDHHTSESGGLLWGQSFDNLVEGLSKALNVQIGYIRNVVQSRVKEFVSDSAKFVEDLGKHNPAANLEIHRNCIPEVVTDESFQTVLEAFKFKAIIKPMQMSMNLPFAEAPTDFLSVTSLSNVRLDNLVKAWSVNSDFNYLESVWYTFFAGQDLTRTFTGPYVSQDDLSSPDLYVRLNVSLAYFLFANYYLKHKPDVTVSESAASLDNRFFEHLQYAAAVLSDTLRQIQSQLTGNILVTYVDTFHKKVSVNADIYDRWLSAGGSADVILGLLVSKKRYYSVSSIDENAEELKKYWSNYVSVDLASVEARKFDSLRQFYKELLIKFTGPDYSEELEQAYLLQNSHHYDQVLSAADKYLKELKREELFNLYSVACKLIAGMKYSFTNAEKFMCDMSEMEACGGDVDAEEAAAVATINYIVDYIQGQIVITPA